MKSGTQTKLEVADWGHEELKFGFWKVNVNILLHSTPAQLRVHHGVSRAYTTHIPSISGYNQVIRPRQQA